MNNCDICCEKFNKLNHKKVSCPFCDLMICRTCCQTYLLSIASDPHCMSCKNSWNREFVDTFCTKKFRNTDLRVHRENTLFEREKSLMPETQVEVERILAMRKLRKIIDEQKSKLIELYQKHRIYYTSFPSIDVVDEKFPDIKEIRKSINKSFSDYNNLRINGFTMENLDTKKFYRKCPLGECRGFLNEEWYCGICELSVCDKCNEKKDENHTCDENAVETMKLLLKDTKPCPKCGTMIHKTSGCSQMWCPDCHTAFNWHNGNIETGKIHNPHYIEFKRKTGLGREHGDIPCGGVPTYTELRSINSSHYMLHFRDVIYDLEFATNYRYIYPYDNNTQLRISYMLGELSEERFKKEIQKRDKMREKFTDIRNIYNMIIDTGGDCLRQYMIDQERHDEIVDILLNLLKYGNECITKIHKRYNCVLPRHFTKFSL